MMDYIKLPRSVFTEDLWHDGKLARLCLYLLSKSGEAISFRSAAKETRLSLQEVRTAVDKLKKNGAITQVVTQRTTQVATQIKFCDTGKKDRSITQVATQKTTQVTTQIKQPLETYVDYRFAEAWQLWLDYRRETNNRYKSPRSERIGYEQFIKKSHNDPAQAMDMVKSTIANGYKGLYPNKNNGTSQQTRTAATAKESRDRMRSLATEIVSRSGNIFDLYNGTGSDSDDCKD